MGKDDYDILIDKIRNRITHWPNRFLSMAGRLQMIRYVLLSIVNFSMAAFLWSGPDLNQRKAKVFWEIVCRRKCDGGLGLRPLKEANQVSCLKLIWRTVSSQASLWAQWTKENLFKNGSFWSIKETTTKGSWMWRKLVKLQDKAKDFHMMKVGDGNNTSFWFDCWSSMGRLYDLFGAHGSIDMGVSRTATVAEALNNRRRRRHRVDVLNEVEKICEDQRLKLTREPDVALWKQSEEKYQAVFKTKQTWELIRKEDPPVQCWRSIWYRHHIPKYAFLHWLAIQNRLSTGDRMLAWNVGAKPSWFSLLGRALVETGARFVAKLVHNSVVEAYGTDYGHKRRFDTDYGHKRRFAGKVPCSLHIASCCLFPLAGEK
ncbi:uncharacterized protein LOC108830235 [Raphanus sativus]|uniref:Uncharacterized protein LOC108830235 n=1 Tax=Raphanus sativus TaxID=3726 RepID=A0A6J0LHH8_RAPSA|nr:uncharacterized protein LOC108830235 [Raphanus sativus]